jgi:DNA-binding MarR family transcriptional regulator
MVDNIESSPPRDNMRTLFNLLKEQLDLRIYYLRQGTEFEKVRVSDVRTFIFASSGGMTIHKLAAALDISRQAVHVSLKKLEHIGVIALQPAENSKRDLVVAITERGKTAMREVNVIVAKFEDELASVVGVEGLENLRMMLKAILRNSQSRNIAAGLSTKTSSSVGQ